MDTRWKNRTVPSLDDDAVWQQLSGIARALAREERLSEGMRVRTRLTVAGHEGSTCEVRGEPILHAGHTAMVVVIAIESAPAPVPDAGQIGRRFGLTPRQTQVALLLAERRTDKEIARELAISRHTARRHAEAVLMRLGVHCRKEVGERLAEVAPAPAEADARIPEPMRAAG